MFGLMPQVEFDRDGISEVIVPKVGAPFIVRRVDIEMISDPLLLSALSAENVNRAHFLQSLDGDILSPLMTEAGVMLLLYARLSSGAVE